MFFIPWSKAAKHERIMQQKAGFAQPGLQPSTTAIQPPSTQHLKRKRKGSDTCLSQLGHSLMRPQVATMSHIEIPAAGKQSAEPFAALLHTDAQPSPGLLDPDKAGVPLGGSLQARKGDRGASPASPSGLREHAASTADRYVIRKHSTADNSREASLRCTIESQFGLEILLKHRELRLIDQEIAKCQAAMEQLRRCTVIPYPAASSEFTHMKMVSEGAGPVFQDDAHYAPAWGIAKGPYSRHYERWLLQDSVFDQSFAAGSTADRGELSISEKSSRGSRAEKSFLASKSRSHRGSSHTHLAAIPAGYPEPNKEKGPIIVKRRSDGKMVKLVCLECRRSDFNSLQGFVNHCRIAHSRTFKSHDLAIEASGEEVECDNEGLSGDLVANDAGRSLAGAGLVHPLIRSAHVLGPSPLGTSTYAPAGIAVTGRTEKKRKLQASTPTHVYNVPSFATSSPTISGAEQPVARSASPIPETPDVLKPSAQAPHLSALFARIGKGGDLAEMVADATTKPVYDPDDDEEEDEDNDKGHEALTTSLHGASLQQSRSTRGIIREILPPPVQTSRQPLRRPAFGADGCVDTPTTAGYIHGLDHTLSFNMHSDDYSQNSIKTPVNFSPNTTDPHPAPSLVSDDGDYDGAHSDYESPSETSDHQEGHHYLDAEVIDHEHIDLSVENNGCSLAHASNHDSGKPQRLPSVAHSRPSTATQASRGVGLEQDERLVDFGSPARNVRGSTVHKNET